MKTILIFTLLIAPLSLFGANAQASSENANAVSISAGIAHPSYNASVLQNPSGLIYNSRPKVSSETFATERYQTRLGMGASLMTGDGSRYGTSFGVRHISIGEPETSLIYGASFNADEVKTAIGFTGFTRMGTKSSTDGNIGFLVGPRAPLRVGFTTFGLKNGPNEYALGGAYDLMRNITVATDIGTPGNLQGTRIKPGVSVGNNDAHVSVSYGLNTGSTIPKLDAVTDRLTLGANIKLNNSVNVQAYYNQLAFWYASLSMAL